MIFACGAMSMALISRPRFHLPFDNEEVLTVPGWDEGARADKGLVKTSDADGVEGSSVSPTNISSLLYISHLELTFFNRVSLWSG